MTFFSLVMRNLFWQRIRTLLTPFLRQGEQQRATGLAAAWVRDHCRRHHLGRPKAAYGALNRCRVGGGIPWRSNFPFGHLRHQ
jgi:hypothetical protein